MVKHQGGKTIAEQILNEWGIDPGIVASMSIHFKTYDTVEVTMKLRVPDWNPADVSDLAVNMAEQMTHANIVVDSWVADTETP